jgi:hypothetical protein
MAFAELKALLLKVAERTFGELWAAICRLVDVFSPSECANYFAAAEYDSDWPGVALMPPQIVVGDHGTTK